MVGRRREDPRPPIEVIGAEPPPEETARVTVGTEPGRRRRVVVAAVVALVAIVTVSVAVGGDEEPREEAERRTTTTRTRSTRRSTTSTAPVVTAPLGPQLPVPTGAALLIGTYAAGRWVHLDLDTGTRTDVRVRGGDGHHPVAVPGGVVLVDGSGTRFVPLPAGDPVELGGPAEVLAAGSTGDVWLVEGNLRDPDAFDGPQTVRLVDPRTGRSRTDPVDLPETAWVSGATAEGVVLSAGGRVYRLAADGAITHLGPGDVLTSAHEHVLVSRCDERARCGVFAVDADSGTAQPLEMDVGTRGFGWSAVASERGELAVVAYGPDGATVSFGSLGGRISSTFEVGDLTTGGWLPADQGFVALAHGRPIRITVQDGRRLEHPIVGLADDRGEFLLVIPP